MKFPPSFSHVLCIADDKDADVEDEGQQDEEEDEDQEDIFELEGTREALQLDPSKFQDPGSESAGQSSELGERVTGRSGFEGKATDEAPSTSGREQVLFCLPPITLIPQPLTPQSLLLGTSIKLYTQFGDAATALLPFWSACLTQRTVASERYGCWCCMFEAWHSSFHLSQQAKNNQLSLATC